MEMEPDRPLTELDLFALKTAERVNNYEIKPDEGMREIFGELRREVEEDPSKSYKALLSARGNATALYLDNLNPIFQQWFDSELEGISRTRTIVNEELRKLGLIR